jgi:3-dehydroquinate dehydratase-1
VDLELRSLKEGATDIAAAVRYTCKLLILSSHQIERTPSLEQLADTIAAAAEAGADIAKLATRLQGPKDLATLLQLLDLSAPIPLSVMGMGPLGPTSRLALARCGSILNYGFLAEANAPGQLPAWRLKELITELRAEN